MPNEKRWYSVGCGGRYFLARYHEKLNACETDAPLALLIGRDDGNRTCICLSRSDALELANYIIDRVEQYDDRTTRED